MGSYNYDLIKARYYEIEFHRRFALPFACLVLAMVGIPLGLSARKGGKSTGFVLTILLVVVYYFFSLLGVQMARQGRMSPWFGSWMGNIFFFVCGLFLLWRVDRMPIEIGNLTAGMEAAAAKAAGHRDPSSRHRQQHGAGNVVAQTTLQRTLSAHPRRHDPARLRAVSHHDHVDLPGAGAGLHLLRAADRHRAQQRAADHGCRIPVEPEPVDDLPDGADGSAAGGAHHLRSAGEIQRADGDEGHRLQHLSRDPAGHCAAAESLRRACSSSISSTFRTPTASRKSCATRSRASRRRPTCRPTASGSSGRDNQIYYYRVFDPDQNIFGGISVFRVRSQHLSVDAAHSGRTCLLGATPAEVGVRAGMGARPEWRRRSRTIAPST